MTQKLSADFSRRIFLEGRAPARPLEEFFSARREPCPPNFRRINSALKNFVINHWLKPVAWVVLKHTLMAMDKRDELRHNNRRLQSGRREDMGRSESQVRQLGHFASAVETAAPYLFVRLPLTLLLSVGR